MITLTRQGLKLAKGSEIEQAQGSANILITVNADDTYTDSTTEIHCGYLFGGKKKNIKLTQNGDGWEIPGEVFSASGPVKFSVGLVKGSVIEKTNEVAYRIKQAPDATVVLPTVATWQELVQEYVNDLIDDMDLSDGSDGQDGADFPYQALTQAEYDALETKEDKLYIITEEVE